MAHASVNMALPQFTTLRFLSCAAHLAMARCFVWAKWRCVMKSRPRASTMEAAARSITTLDRRMAEPPMEALIHTPATARAAMAKNAFVDPVISAILFSSACVLSARTRSLASRISSPPKMIRPTPMMNGDTHSRNAARQCSCSRVRSGSVAFLHPSHSIWILNLSRTASSQKSSSRSHQTVHKTMHSGPTTLVEIPPSAVKYTCRLTLANISLRTKCMKRGARSMKTATGAEEYCFAKSKQPTLKRPTATVLPTYATTHNPSRWVPSLGSALLVRYLLGTSKIYSSNARRTAPAMKYFAYSSYSESSRWTESP
mmetsp:Transcript_6769/g.11655  ORF Transcript_6769/g.11655 Transcript_6769/m.11655 type:complete len:314 (+) Transcript_6769:156-1097(+)